MTPQSIQSPALSIFARGAMAAVTAMCCLAPLPAQSLSTTYQHTGGMGLNDPMYFDLIAQRDLEITGFDCNLATTAGRPTGLEVWIRPGTSWFQVVNACDWTRVAASQGTTPSAGPGSPTPFALDRPICIQAGSTLGVALVPTAGGRFVYTDGVGRRTWANSDLSLIAGSRGDGLFFREFLFDYFNGTVHYRPAPGCGPQTTRPSLLAVGDTAAKVRSLRSSGPLPFEDGWDLRWRFANPAGTRTGAFGAAVLNVALAGSAPVGNTPGIPGFNQLWSGSFPSGDALVLHLTVGPAEGSIAVPNSLFQAGDTVRFQGLLIDALAPGPLPVTATCNTIEFVHRNPLQVEVRCEGRNSYNIDPRFGFFSIENVAAPAPIVEARLDWVQSSNPSQSAAEFDTDQAYALGAPIEVFENGNSTIASCAGTYRNGSDVTTGLVYDAANTLSLTRCDPTALSGWTGSNPGADPGDWRTLEFRFSHFEAGERFEFDCQVDGAQGPTGADMAGLVVTIRLADGTIWSGEVSAVSPQLGIWSR